MTDPAPVAPSVSSFFEPSEKTCISPLGIDGRNLRKSSAAWALFRPIGPEILCSIVFRSSQAVHGGSISGSICSECGRARIRRANREVGRFVLQMSSARFRRGWYGSRRAVRAAKVCESLSSLISASRILASFNRAGVRVVRYTSKIALALLYVTLLRSCR